MVTMFPVEPSRWRAARPYVVPRGYEWREFVKIG